MSKIKTNVKEINWALLDQALVSGSNFIISISLARFLGLEQFGTFSLVWLFILLIISVQYALVITPMMTKVPVKSAVQIPSYVGSLLLLQLCTAILFCVILVLVIIFIEAFYSFKIDDINLWVLCWVLISKQLQDFIRRYLFVTARPQIAFFNDIVCYISQLILLMLFFKWGVLGLGSVFILIGIATSAAVILATKVVAELEFSILHIANVAIDTWQYSKWMVASSLLTWTSSNLVLFVTGLTLSTTALGAVRAAQNVIGLLHVMFQAIENFMPVQAAKNYHAKGIKGLNEYLSKCTLYGGLTTLGVVSFCAVFAESLMRLIYGEGYEDYAYIMYWFSGIYIFSFLTLPVMSGLRVIEKTKAIFNSMLWMSGVTLLVAYPLCLYFGISGAMFTLLLVRFGIYLLLKVSYNKNMLHA